jgi:hypothetical protein
MAMQALPPAEASTHKYGKSEHLEGCVINPGLFSVFLGPNRPVPRDDVP